MTPGERQFRDAVALIMEEQIRPLLPATLGDYQLTVLARVPGEPEADLIVTQDENQHLARMIRRAQARERARDV